jgi:hypothetical protein
MAVTVAELVSLGLADDDARIVARECRARGRGADAAYEVLKHVNLLIGGCGVETIRAEYAPQHGAPIADYINRGETYAPTLIYDIVKDRWHMCGWGDWYETTPDYRAAKRADAEYERRRYRAERAVEASRGA